MKVRVFRVDGKGRMHIPKDVRDRLGITGGVKGRVEGDKLVIEPVSDLFDKLASQVKFNFRSVEEALPGLRGAAERRLIRGIS